MYSIVTRAFRLLYINRLPTAWRVERTQSLLYIIQGRSEQLALFVCYIPFNCLLHGVERTASSEYNRGPYSPNITGRDRRARLDASLQCVVCSEVPLFCSNFNSNRSSNSTNLLIHMASLHSNVAMAIFV
jgi:hypothetical protein